MKKNIYLISFFVFSISLLSSCGDTKWVDMKPPYIDGEITVNEKSLTFPAAGGSQVLTITSTSKDGWDINSNISWIEIGKPNFETGEVVITVAPHSSIEPVDGKITITTGMKHTTTIDVLHKGWGPLHERSSLARMNLKGDISELSYYVDPLTIFFQNPDIIANLKFNENGMLTYYEHSYLWEIDYTLMFEKTITYDSEGRISKIDSFITNSAGGNKFTLRFEYGDHGKYIETENLIYHLENTLITFGTYSAWMPRMIKNLVGVYGNNEALAPDSDFQFEYKPAAAESDYQMECQIELIEEGELFQATIASYRFDGFYPKEMNYLGFVMDYLFSFDRVYNIDPSTGYFIDMTTNLDMDGDKMLIGEDRYDKNFINSLVYKIAPFDSHPEGMDVKINDNDDVEEIINTSVFSCKFKYEYDEKGNWITIEAYEMDAGIDEFSHAREITYRK